MYQKWVVEHFKATLLLLELVVMACMQSRTKTHYFLVLLLLAPGCMYGMSQITLLIQFFG